MALGDVKIVGNLPPTKIVDVDDRTTSGASATIKQGEPIKRSGNFAVILGDGEPTITAPMLGIAAAESTETSSADGTVEYYPVEAGVTILECNATTATNIDTAAELLGVKLDTVTFDLSGGTFTIDEDEGSDDNVHGLQIIGGNIDKGTLQFTVRGYAAESTSST